MNNPSGTVGHWREQIVGWSTGAVIVVIAVLGGGGASALPGFEALCHLAGFALLALLIATGRKGTIDRAAYPWLAFALLALLLPLAQLVPLPAAWTTSLPGRELAQAIRAELGAQGAVPFSLDPDQTMISALSLVPAIALFAATLRCNQVWRERLALFWIAMALAAVIVGSLQVASSGTAVAIYETPHREAATGFFANRNHNSIFLLSALILFVAVVFGGEKPRGRAFTLLRLGLAALLCAGVFITTSRAGILLLVVTLPVLFALFAQGRALPRPSWRIAAMTGAALAAFALFIAFNPVAREVIGRFSVDRDPRWVYWPDVVFTLSQFWPAGSGIGTFAAVFATQEQLGTINTLYVNHAHNDYLELALEGGIVAVILMAAFALMLALRVRAVARCGQGAARRLAAAGMLAICAILLHSLVDYPLRAITIAAMFGFFAGLLFRPVTDEFGSEVAR